MNIILSTIFFIHFVSSMTSQNPLIQPLLNAGITILDDSNFTTITGIQPSQSNYQDGILTDNRIGELKGLKNYLILFYNGHCPHCKIFVEGIYKNIKPQLANLEFDVEPAAIECIINTETCKKFYIQGYPTIYYFNSDGRMFLYPRKLNRTMDSILLFVKYGHVGKQIDMSLMEQGMNTQQFIKLLETRLYGNKVQAQNKQTDIQVNNKQEKQQNNRNYIRSKRHQQDKNQQTNILQKQKQNSQSLGIVFLKIGSVILIIFCIIDRFVVVKNKQNEYKRSSLPNPQSVLLSPDNSSQNQQDDDQNRYQSGQQIISDDIKQQQVEFVPYQNQQQQKIYQIKEEDILQEVYDDFD